MEKPDFTTLGLTPESTPLEIVQKINEFSSWIVENKDDMTVGEIRRAMNAIILCAAAILSPLDGDMPVSMVLGVLAGKAMEGEIIVEASRQASQAEQASMN